VAGRIVRAVEDLEDELVEFSADLIRIPTVNPPGVDYRPCAELIGRRLQQFGFEVEEYVAEDCAEHSAAHPRVNVVGLLQGASERPLLHINGHFDVVPVGHGWTLDPFGGQVRNGRLYGRGSADMKAGLACGMYAAEALRRAGVTLEGSVEVSGTVDEESGGFAGVAHLAKVGRLTAERIDYAIIPEPLNVDRVCVGHRGVYWFKVTARGQIGHGSMPFLGVNAIAETGAMLEAVRTRLEPKLAQRLTAMPVVPDEARRATININAILGGQGGETPQTPCIADHCETVFDRRFLIEEGFEASREEIVELLHEVEAENPHWKFEIEDLMVVHPTQTPDGSPLTASLERNIQQVLGRAAVQIASPGTYDQKHFSKIGGVHHCVAYGPGVIEQAHQPDEWCGIEDMVNSTKVMALTIAELVGCRG
jgi:succinyl-diaminopimelate desuccinylase